MRYAIYFTPRQDDKLARLAAGWIGRDAFDGTRPTLEVAGLSADEIAALTRDARRYGFHATLKAPFRLAAGASEVELDAEVAALASGFEPIALPLVVAELDGFLALVPAAPSPALDRLAGESVRSLDRFRAPLTQTDIAKRNPDALGPELLENLRLWGYPYVFDAFRFHMTLTRRLDGVELLHVRAAIEATFRPTLERPVVVDGLALFVEPEASADFVVKSWHALGAGQDRKSA